MMNGDFEISTFHLNRDKFDAAKEYRGSPAEILEASTLKSYKREENSSFELQYDFQKFIGRWHLL